MTNRRQHQRAAVELLNTWTADIYGARSKHSEDHVDDYVPLVWSIDTDGHLRGELPIADN
ncbi:hypothetical protein [Streptomyces sp. NPDC047024]|uniref:hypothetical protein n=1 Tax=Streptomyces sp. NPDC047024 TaxID=3155476 RepID=UPI0033FCF97C